MTVLHTAAKRLKNQTLEEWFLWTLEKFAKNPDIDPISLFVAAVFKIPNFTGLNVPTLVVF
jgi:hypothetical protein